jgi:hypothetical protein
MTTNAPRQAPSQVKTIIELGSIVTEKATASRGMLTHMQVETNNTRMYLFQPNGLNPETGHPVKKMWVVEERLEGGQRIVEPELPLAVLGTKVTDIATGFTGIAVSIVLHISGCVHVNVQPRGKLDKTGAAIEECDFDIRRLKGEAIPVMTKAEIVADQKVKPSPIDIPKRTFSAN